MARNMVKKRYSSYNTNDRNTPWHIVILDYEWWIDDKETICKWFKGNCSDTEFSHDNPIVKLSNDEYSMWQLAWG